MDYFVFTDSHTLTMPLTENNWFKFCECFLPSKYNPCLPFQILSKRLTIIPSAPHGNLCLGLFPFFLDFPFSWFVWCVRLSPGLTLLLVLVLVMSTNLKVPLLFNFFSLLSLTNWIFYVIVGTNNCPFFNHLFLTFQERNLVLYFQRKQFFFL